jgi:transposase
MRPLPWNPPVELSPLETTIIKRIRRAKLFIFLRRHRHTIFDAAFQAELATLYKDSPLGQPPIPPAQLALATILQAYMRVSDDEVIEATVMDRRWQLVLDCLDCEHAPFSKGTLVAFRERLIEHDMDRQLIERTVQVAEQTKEVGSRQLRGVLDSSPLWGAGRVEDTYNLLGHALRKVLGILARQQGRELAAVAGEAGADLLAGPSLKAALDADWDDPLQRQEALQHVVRLLETVEGFLAQQEEVPVAARESLTVAQQVREQDTEMLPQNVIRLRQGVAKQRRISVEDGEMRHGRKSRSQRVNGYKRHVLRDLDTGLVRAVGITPANVPEGQVTDALMADLAHQPVTLTELHIDRGYLASKLVRERSPELTIYCKAWPVRNGSHFPKTAFVLDFEQGVIRCPNQIEIPFALDSTVHFPAATCAVCPLRARCTSSSQGRSIRIHPDEPLLQELRQRHETAAGRAKLRERVKVEHSLAHIGHWQGDRARYGGSRKNLFDLRRCAVVHNLHVIAGDAQHLLAA